MAKKSKRALITNNHLADYAGSEIVVLELTEYLTELGYEIDIITNVYDYPIKNEFAKLSNVSVIEYPNYLDLKDVGYDIIWIHHQLIPKFLMLGEMSSNPLLVFNHMSPYEPYESSFIPKVEGQMADLVLANSEETRRFLLDNTDIKEEIIKLFPNPAPDSFAKARIAKHIKNNIIKIGLVSNHPPKELMEALNNLDANKFKLKYIGRSNDVKRVRAADINNFDLVITIGKTVQYCIESGTPVYIYDHYGGPGFLTSNNYSKAKEFNFSGRGGFGRKSKNIIYEDLSSMNYDSLLKDFIKCSSKDIDYYNLPLQIDSILKIKHLYNSCLLLF